MSVIKRKRQKTSAVWNDFDEVEMTGVVKKAVCKYCKLPLSTGGRGASTTHLKRLSEICLQRRLKLAGEKKQSVIPFQPYSGNTNPFLTPSVKFCNEKMREIISTAIMVHEYPFSIVEDEVFTWAIQYANPEYQKVSRRTTRNDCLALYEVEKRKLKAQLRSVSKVSLTTDMWKSTHQVVEYMVITGHFVDAGWKLQKRVLSFVKVPAPRRGVDVADAIFKCLKAWGIEKKVFSISVDNAFYNDACIRNLKDNLSLNSMLFLRGALFHVRCCAHILNLLVQDGLGKIKDIVYNIRESVKYIKHNDARLKAFCDVVEQKGLKERKLIIDCPTRWNSTFQMLSTALIFKSVFGAYSEREPHYNYAPSRKDWDKVEKICQLLGVFNRATRLISGSDYPTSNLYLAEVWKVKQVIDKAIDDNDQFMREMAGPMKVKFDKYWGECNLLMAIASVLDPRWKFHIIDICFPLIYKQEGVAQDNIKKLKVALEELFDEYVAVNEQVSSFKEDDNGGSSSSGNDDSCCGSQITDVSGVDEIMSMVREKEAIPAMKSELIAYLDESVHIPDDDNSFSALEWWRNNNLKYKVLSKMAADVLAIPISIVASESTFSTGGRVIDEYRSILTEDSIEALICRGDWLRHKYNLKKKSKVEEQLEKIILKI